MRASTEALEVSSSRRIAKGVELVSKPYQVRPSVIGDMAGVGNPRSAVSKVRPTLSDRPVALINLGHYRRLSDQKRHSPDRRPATHGTTY
jgi:hypothetical protein